MRNVLSRSLVLLILASGANLAVAQETTSASALGDHLPAAPSGWDSQDGESVESSAMGHDVAQVSRVFTNGDGARVEMLFIGSTAMVAASRSAGMMFQNSAMLNQMNAADPDKQFAAIDEAGWGGWTVVDQGAGESEATAFNEDLVVKIETNSGDADMLAMFMDLVPWEALGALNQ